MATVDNVALTDSQPGRQYPPPGRPEPLWPAEATVLLAIAF